MDPIELSYRSAPAAATRARVDVTERLAARLGAGALEDVRLLVSELITNAVRHGSLTATDKVSLKAQLDDGVVRIEVRDPGCDGEVAPRAPGPLGGGYGLLLVDRLAKRWGVDRRDGTVVWCELAPGVAR
jgi:anti-sigma regulatory factor (Ser/Thr protein kinase)